VLTCSGPALRLKRPQLPRCHNNGREALSTLLLGPTTAPRVHGRHVLYTGPQRSTAAGPSLSRAHGDAELALAWVTQLGHDLQDKDYPPEARSLGRTLIRWRNEIAAWHQAHVSNGPTEAVNNLIKRVKRAAFGFTSFRNYRIRSLLYAGKPNWELLATVSPS
jgi:hypothetical protein